MPAVLGQAPRREVRLSQGAIRYREVGEGPPIVFVHSWLASSDLWRKVVPPLADRFRCILPDLPLGSHRLPFPADADLSLPGLSRLVADFLAALDLRGVTLVGTDTGGAICQGVVAWHPERIGRLILTNCDAFENFPPAAFKPLVPLARRPAFGALLGRLLRRRLVQRAVFAVVARTPPDPPILDAFFGPAATDVGVRRDAVKVLAAASNRHSLAAARAFPGFAKPVLIVWAPEDRLLFPLRYGERLRDAFPDARLETVAGSRTFIMEDQPARLAAAIGSFLAERGVAAAEERLAVASAG